MYTLWFEDYDGGVRELGQFNNIASVQLYAEEWIGRWGTNEEQMFDLNGGLTMEAPDGRVYGDVVSFVPTYLYNGF